MENKILLSICIPTHNGGLRLKQTIECVTRAKKGRDDIEVIVSDNASDDETTLNIIKEFEKNNIIRANYNKENRGFNGNLLVLIDKMAQGEYCWVIGDDDYLDFDAIDLIYEFLANKVADYISINFRLMPEEKFGSSQKENRQFTKIEKAYFFQCLDNNASEGNILGSFMSTHIFRLSSVRQTDKKVVDSRAWDSYATIFPNTYLMSHTFYNSQECYYTADKLLTAVTHPKDYSEKWNRVLDEVFPALYQHYEEMCGTEKMLARNKIIIDDILTRRNLKKLFKGEFSKVNYHYLLPHLLIRSYIHYKTNRNSE